MVRHSWVRRIVASLAGRAISGKAGSVSAVAEGSVPAAEPPESEQDLPCTEATVAATPSASRKRRRNVGSAIFGFLWRLWIPLVVLAVIAAGGIAVSRLNGMVGSEKSDSYAGTNDAVTTLNPKYLRYEIFGPSGTAAQISFFNAAGDPEFIEGASLPWSLEFPISAAGVIGSIAAQSNGNSIGCRILVDNDVKAEKTTEGVSAFTSCLLKAA
jgi:hypothetical protein